MTEYEIRVESHATTVPIPIGFVVFADGQRVAYLSVEQVRESLKRYDEMEAARTRPSAAGEQK